MGLMVAHHTALSYCSRAKWSLDVFQKEIFTSRSVNYMHILSGWPFLIYFYPTTDRPLLYSLQMLVCEKVDHRQLLIRSYLTDSMNITLHCLTRCFRRCKGCKISGFRILIRLIHFYNLPLFYSLSSRRNCLQSIVVDIAIT